MKHINREEILQRRRDRRIKTEAKPEWKPQFNQCVDRELRHVNDQTIEHLIRTALKGRGLTNDDREDILKVIAGKTGIHLNKHLLLDQITLTYCAQVIELSVNWEKSRKSYFVFKGSLLVYEQRPHENRERLQTVSTLKNYKNLYDDEEKNYSDHEEFQKYHSDYHLIEEIEHFGGTGVLFRRTAEEIPRRRKLIALNAVLVTFNEPPNSFEFVFHDGITNEGKVEILNQFPVLKVLGKKVKHFIKFFTVRHFNLNEAIYRTGDAPSAIYFLIKGEVKFEYELTLAQPEAAFKGRYESPFIVSTETVGEANYFGEEEVLSKSHRFQTAKSCSSKCVLLEFQAEKFSKLMEYSDFRELILRIAAEKREAREEKLAKMRELLEKQSEKKEGRFGVVRAEVARLPTEPLYTSKERRSFEDEKIKWMHGHIVKKEIKDKPSKSAKRHEPFSMLHVNPDMYEATRKKYRKYSLKTVSSSPERHYNCKNTWKALNLEDVIRDEEVVLFAPEGRKYFECARRLESQVKETRSCRPKTSSSSYQTKLQYIAYLQQFNH